MKIKNQLDPERHIPGLDGLRGLAVLMVVLFHTTCLNQVILIDDLFWRFTKALERGVDLFFCLSGFLITGILLALRNSESRYKTFLLRRTVRIFPLYYAVVAFSVFAPYLVPSLQRLDLPQFKDFGLPYWFYLSNIWVASHPLLGVSWSLAIEEQFYLLWPMVIFHVPLKWLKYCCLFLIAIGPTYRWLTTVEALGLPPLLMLARVDLLAMGAMVALWMRDLTPVPTRSMLRLMTWGGGLILCAMVSVAERFGGKTFNVWGRSLGGMFFALLIGSLASGNSSAYTRHFFESQALRTIGKYSYAIYFFHPSVDAALRRMVNLRSLIHPVLGTEIPAQLLYSAIVVLVTLGLAILSWEVYEKQFLRLKRYFPMPQVGKLQHEQAEVSSSGEVAGVKR